MKPIEAVEPQHKRQPWGEEIVLAETPHYTLKKLFYRAGKAGGLQYHALRAESFHLHKGAGIVRYDDGTGTLVERPLRPGDTVTIPPFAPHQFEAILDSVVFEASHPIDRPDRVNVAERYGRQPDSNDLPTTWSEDEIAAREAQQT